MTEIHSCRDHLDRIGMPGTIAPYECTVCGKRFDDVDLQTGVELVDEPTVVSHTFFVEVDLALGWGFSPPSAMAQVELTLRRMAERALVDVQAQFGAPTEPVLIRCVMSQLTRRCDKCGDHLDDNDRCLTDALAADDPSIAGCGEGGYYSCDEHGIYDVGPGGLWGCPDCRNDGEAT